MGSKLKTIALIITGAILYTFLSWVPLVGAGLIGLAIGYLTGPNIKKAIVNTVISGVLGTVLILSSLWILDPFESGSQKVMMSLFIIWVLLIWNTINLVTMVAGAIIGAMGNGFKEILPKDLIPGIKKKKDEVSYMICPRCGSGYILGENKCTGCEQSLTG